METSRVVLVPIERSGVLADEAPPLPQDMHGVLAATVAMYESVGFSPPWIGYVAISDGQAVGTCGFKSAPIQGRVEIAYYTIPPFEGRGIATAMAAHLTSLALNCEPGLAVTAQTLPDRDASHRVLEKCGFEPTGSVQHPEDGTVLEWQKARAHGV